MNKQLLLPIIFLSSSCFAPGVETKPTTRPELRKPRQELVGKQGLRKALIYNPSSAKSYQFPENFSEVAQRYSRQFKSWQKAFEKNYPRPVVQAKLKQLFLTPRKFATKRNTMTLGAIYLIQLRDHLRGLFESSQVDGTQKAILNKSEFIKMLNQAWPKEFCSRWWGWVDARKAWVIQYLNENQNPLR